jgi:hypothetical protein
VSATDPDRDRNRDHGRGYGRDRSHGYDRDHGYDRNYDHDRGRDGIADVGREPRSAFERRCLQVLDALVYALAVAGVLAVGTGALSVGFGGGLVGAKYLLFFLGFVLFATGAIGMRPTAAWKDDEESAAVVGRAEETRFQGTLHRLPPLRRYELAPAERLSAGTKLFVASVLVLAISFVLEAVFGVVA